MSQLTMARPYAKAIFELALAEKALPEWSDMLFLASTTVKDPVFVEAIKNPTIHKEDLVAVICSIGGNAFTSHMRQLITLLADFKRLPLLPEITLLYEGLRAKAEQRVHVVITSAQPLDNGFQQQFITALKKRLHGDVDLECITDQKILGGAIIRANDLVIDGSVRGRLTQLGNAVGIL